jgi:multiple sugar transport system permease protein
MKLSNLIKYLLVVVVLAVILFPFFVVVESSFKSYNELMSGKVTFWPEKPTAEAYGELLVTEGQYDDVLSFLGYLGRKAAISLHLRSGESTKGLRDMPGYLINSITTSAGASLLGVTVATLAAYGLARYRFKGRDFLSRSVLFIYVFPTILLVVPVYKMFSGIKVGESSLLDSHYGLMIVYAAIAAPFLTWLLQAFFESIPREIEESAEVDGAGGLSRFFRITLPLAAPGIITAAIYGFVTAWGEFTFAVILINTNDNKTAAIGLAELMGASGVYFDWERLFAGTVIIVFPILLFFFPIARYFVQGFMAGAVKE